jgi:hypothetical protein
VGGVKITAARAILMAGKQEELIVSGEPGQQERPVTRAVASGPIGRSAVARCKTFSLPTRSFMVTVIHGVT